MKIVEPGVALEAFAKLYREVCKEPPWCENWEVEKAVEHLAGLRAQEGMLLVAIDRIWLAGMIIGMPITREQLYAKSGTKFGGYFDADRNPAFYIAELVTSPKYRGQGVGRALSLALMQYAKGKEFDRFVLRTHVDALPARALYRSLGFSETNIHDMFYPDRTYWVKINR